MGNQSIREILIADALLLVERLEMFVVNTAIVNPSDSFSNKYGQGDFFEEGDRDIIEFLLKMNKSNLGDK